MKQRDWYVLRVQLVSDIVGDFSPYTPKMQVKNNKSDATPIVDLSANLTLLPLNNQLVLSVGSDTSLGWSWAGDGVTRNYSIVLDHNTDSTKDVRVIYGTFTVDREVTR
jgi:hypothetical protein